MTAGAGFVTGAVNLGTSTGTNPPAGIGNIDQTNKTKMKMNSDYIIGDDYQDPKHGCLAVIVAILCTVAMCLLFSGCKTVGTVSEKVNIRDSVVYNYRDSVAIHWIDSIRYVGQHTVKDDSTNLVISFGNGGGTYNAKTGEATNVTAVQQTDTHHEQRDSTAFWRSQYRDELAKTDSLTQQVSDYQYRLDEERKRARSGYDRFCSWFFWIVVVLLLAVGGFWICDKIPACKPYTTAIKMFFKII